MTAAVLVPVLLAGGAGTRLWPISRATLPKPFAPLAGDETLLQQAARRVTARAPARRVVIVGNQAHDFLVTRQLAAIDPDLVQHRLLEPAGRNTAAAIALAALYVRETIDPDAVLWVCPTDHLMRRPEALEGALAAALQAAAAGALVTFGITPTRPETAYGYVCAREPMPGAPGALRVARFVEKPPEEEAKAMLQAGDHFWNSGMFAFRAERILAAFDRHAPDIKRAVEVAFAASEVTAAGARQIPLALYQAVPAAPIDKAIMEHDQQIALVPCDPGWSDLGSWQALWEQLPKDADGNAARGDVVLDDVHDCVIQADRRLVACAACAISPSSRPTTWCWWRRASRPRRSAGW